VSITVFEPVLNDAGAGWAHATLHEIHEKLARSTRDLVEVRINGQRAGQMTPAMSKKFLPIIQTLAAQGRLCATPAFVRGNRLQVDVRVCGAQASNLPQEWLLEHANHALARQTLPNEGARSAVNQPITTSGPAAVNQTPSRTGAATADTRPANVEARSTIAPSAPVVGEAGWFADPQGVAPLRYWDGMAWTSRIRMR
jgi:collagen type III alpha